MTHTKVALDMGEVIKFQSELQEHYGYQIRSEETSERVELIKEYLLGMLDEVHEALHETSWKSWSSSEFLHDDLVVAELADAFAFLTDVLAVVDPDGTKFVKAVKSKQKKNAARARIGYWEDENKCENCNRALDDFNDSYYVDGKQICPICWNEDPKVFESHS